MIASIAESCIAEYPMPRVAQIAHNGAVMNHLFFVRLESQMQEKLFA